MKLNQAFVVGLLTLGSGVILFQIQQKIPSQEAHRVPAAWNGPTANAGGDLYLNRVQPIFAAKCLNCHGCTGSPCEMKIDSFEAVDRGATKRKIYSKNLLPGSPVRMKDAQGDEWAKRGFFPVVSRSGTSEDRLRDSLLYRLVLQAHEKNLPDFDLGNVGELVKNSRANQTRSCVQDLGEFHSLIAEHPFAGMPFVLPGLSDTQMSTLKTWIAQGAPGPSSEAMRSFVTLSSSEESVLASWERFFNPTQGVEKAKAALVSRYLYEHVFMAKLSVDGIPNRLFELVRARRPYPEPVEEIVTSAPMDDPKTEQIFYRLKLNTELVAQKSHFVWKLSEAKKTRLKELFYDSDWGPGPIAKAQYKSESPFVNFARIPAAARYHFMLDENRLIVNGMIRGPVCIGNIATYAIRDDFWVFFANPDTDVTVLDPSLGSGNDVGFMTSKDPLSRVRYRSQLEKTVRRLKPQGYGLNDIWNGDGRPQGVLTILRHGTNATVLEGPQGELPRTLWYMNYAGFERLYYDLVAQYQFWLGAEHGAKTWNYMSTLREGYEEDFISLLPDKFRSRTRKEWTQGLGAFMTHFVLKHHTSGGRSTAIEGLDEERPVESLVEQLRDYLGPQVWGAPDVLDAGNPTEALAIPQAIASVDEFERAAASASAHSEGTYAANLPEVMHVMLRADQPHAYTIIMNRGYKFNNLPLAQSNARDPKLDTLMVLRGVVGDFPEIFVDLPLAQSADFWRELTHVDSVDGYKSFQKRFGMMRNNPRFWAFLYELQNWNKAQIGVEAGALDLNYYLGY